MEIVCSDVNGK